MENSTPHPVEARFEALEARVLELETRLHTVEETTPNDYLSVEDQLKEAVREKKGLFASDLMKPEDIMLQMFVLHPNESLWYPYDARDKKVGMKRVLSRLFKKVVYTTYEKFDHLEYYGSGKVKYGNTHRHSLYIVRNQDKYKGVPPNTLARVCDSNLVMARRELGAKFI